MLLAFDIERGQWHLTGIGCLSKTACALMPKHTLLVKVISFPEGREPTPHTAADLGVTITASALEMSNVDIANEFSDMIITQRGFQSNSKMITVGDEILETVINMKR